METKILNFINLLRDSNIRISISESIDVYKALQICDITNKNEFKILLRSLLIKDNKDIDNFNKIFNLYFSEPIEDEDCKMDKDEFKSIMEDLINNMDDESFNKLGEPQNIQDNIYNKFKMNDEFESYDKNKMDENLFKYGSEYDLLNKAKELSSKYDYKKSDIDNIEGISKQILLKNNYDNYKIDIKGKIKKSNHKDIDNKYNMLQNFLKDEIEKKMINEFGKDLILKLIKDDNILDKDIQDLSKEDLIKIENIIKKLAKKISTNKSRKYKSSKNGNLNIRKTIRSSMQYGNISSELRFKNKKKTKPELVLLCDISGSVWLYVCFLLQLLLSIQNTFTKVESYVFIDHIKNVTKELSNCDDIYDTINKILNDRSLGNGTDYGNVFNEFYNEQFKINNLFNKKTVLIIMGDGENTGKNLGDDYLRYISNQCKKVYWLNPKSIEEWYRGYSNIKDYELYCEGVYECNTIRQLENFINRLIKI